MQEALYLLKLFSFMYDVKNGEANVTIGVNNQGTIALVKNLVHQQRSKHIDVRYHFLRDVADGIVKL